MQGRDDLLLGRLVNVVLYVLILNDKLHLENDIQSILIVEDVPEPVRVNFKYASTPSRSNLRSHLQILEHWLTPTSVQDQFFHLSDMRLLTLNLLFRLHLLLELLNLAHQILQPHHSSA